MINKKIYNFIEKTTLKNIPYILQKKHKKYKIKTYNNVYRKGKILYMQEKFMKMALKEAKKAYDKKEIPVGAIIVKNGKVIARAHNLKEIKQDTTKHAEILAIQKASKKLESWRLEDCEMYVTLEPCSMCAGALIQARIKKIYIGTMDYKTGACGSVLNLLSDYKFNHMVEVETGVLKTECEEMLKNFFKELRLEKKNKKEGN